MNNDTAVPAEVIVSLARAREQAVDVVVTGGVLGQFIVRGVSAIEQEAPETMTWISERRMGSVVASLLRSRVAIVPEGFQPTAEMAGGIFIRCKEPKALFFSLASECFGHREVPVWREPSEQELLGCGAHIAPGVKFSGTVHLGDNVSIGPNTCVSNARLGTGVRIGANCVIGGVGFGFVRDHSGAWIRVPHFGDVVVGDGVEIGSCVCIDRGTLGTTMIEAAAKIDNLVHIAHNVSVGAGSLVIAHAMIGGSATIGQRVWIAPNAAIMNQVSVGDGATVGLGAVVIRSVPSNATVVGNPARELKR